MGHNAWRHTTFIKYWILLLLHTVLEFSLVLANLDTIMTGVLHERTPSPDLRTTMKRNLKKPMMEKRRRDRINTSLTQLKNLVLEATNKDTSQYSKLEKADILEMTVNHLKKSQYQQMAVASNVDPHSTGKFRLGFAECAAEVTRYLSNVDGFNPEIRTRLLNHLSNSYQQKPLVQQQAPVSTLTSSLPGSYHQNAMSGQFAAQMNGQVTLVPIAGTLSPPISPVQNSPTFPQGFQVTPLYINTQPRQAPVMRVDPVVSRPTVNHAALFVDAQKPVHTAPIAQKPVHSAPIALHVSTEKPSIHVTDNVWRPW